MKTAIIVCYCAMTFCWAEIAHNIARHNRGSDPHWAATLLVGAMWPLTLPITAIAVDIKSKDTP